MATTLAHRGPDGDGAAIAGHAALGCRRLAIIDVAGGAQPLRNETGDVIAVCNGEIYNRAALRAALEARGHRFRTRSDAEVLPHLYEEHGVDFVNALDGMFGLALWDARRGRLILARDRLGEKPLYYAATADGFFFASEPKALLATGAVGFDVPGFDERGHAAVAARALGTRHRTLTITPELFLEGVRDLLPVLDEPLADPAFVPTFLLSRFARSEVKVVLVGEGGDELFAGYPTYLGGRLSAGFRRLSPGLRRALAAAAPLLGAPRGNTTLRYLLRRFLEAAEAPAAARHRAWTGCVGAELLTAIAAPGGPLVAPPEPDTPPARTEVDALLALDLTGYLADDLLPKLDRATMAASLEGRAPYLDHHLVELACRLPLALKLHGLSSKRVLRRAITDLVRAAIRRRVKRALTVPLAAWLDRPLLPFGRSPPARLDPPVGP